MEQEKSLALIQVRVGNYLFTAIVIDSPESASYLKIGNTIQLLFKETEVLIGRNIEANSISLQNKISCTIASMEEGMLLSKLVLESSIGQLVSIITTHAVQQLQLSTGDKVLAMIKTNEIMLAE